jgi:hypothetical protein
LASGSQEESKEKDNFHVFLTYLPQFREHKMASFENKFLIVPTLNLKNSPKARIQKKRDLQFLF